jgi:hypothetical protein
MLRGGAPGEGFVTLTLDASYPDRQIRELLASGGFTTTIGESSQWVFLDDFGKLEQVPLDRYWDRVEPFDPRNDGYAELLQSFFVYKGERRIFISLKGAPLDPGGRIKAALGDIRYSLSVPEQRRSPLAPAILFSVAAALTLLLLREIHITLFFLPLWASLTGLGAAGFALTAVLAGLSKILREPARDYFISRRYGTTGERTPLPAELWMLSGLMFVAAALLAVFGSFPLLTVPAALVLLPVVLCSALRTESCRGMGEGHIRFKPVPITPLARRPDAYAPVMAPFALAALALPFLPGAFPAAGGSGALLLPRTDWKGAAELNAERYQEHAAFQQAFSYTSLGRGESSYLRYFLAEDGFIGGNGSAEAVLGEAEEIPPFPLAPLIDFLANYAYTDPESSSPRGESPAGALIVLGLCVLLILRDWRGRRRWGKLSLYMDKRIAA